MSIKALAKRIGERLLPRDCLLCRAPSGDTPCCPPCAASLPRLPAPACPRCALPVPAAGPCGACLSAPPHFDATRAAFRYQFPLDRLIQALKYQHRLPVAGLLGDALRAAVPLADDCLVLPMPLSAERLHERGFNQSAEIARRLGRPLQLEGVHHHDRPPQANLAWRERAANVRHAFECGLDLRGRRVVVVDDVMTTGATLNELARTLKAAGAIHVENWVVARALRD